MKDSIEVHKVVTANRLSDGAVVYAAVENDHLTWVQDIHDAKILHGSVVDRVLRLAKADEDKNIVVGIYDIEIAGRNEPLSKKEEIRAAGPTVRFGADAVVSSEPDYTI